MATAATTGRVPTRYAEYFVLAELKRRGWTLALVREMVGECDLTTPNPWYRSAPRLKLYDKTRIYEIEASEEFEKKQEQLRARKEAAARAVETKLEDLRREIEQSQIKIPKLSQQDLIERACRSWNNHKIDLACDGRISGDDWSPASPASDPEFLNRISVNYIRHELTSYERKLRANYGRVGRSEAYLLISRKVFEAIAATYPHLAEECERQLRRRTQSIADEAGEQRVTITRRDRGCPICWGHGAACQSSSEATL